MKYTMDDFINKNILVRVGKVHMQDFLKMCEKRGLRWFSGEKATEWEPNNIYGAETTIGCGVLGGKRLSFGQGNIGYVQWQVIDFKDIADKPIRNYQIIIDCDGDITTAKMIINGKEVKTAQAKRNPADKFNWKLAADLAFVRLWGWGEKKPAFKGVKRHARVGEYVKITNACSNHGERYKNGDILRVDSLFLPGEANGCVYLKGADNVACSPREYVVLEGYKPSK